MSNILKEQILFLSTSKNNGVIRRNIESNSKEFKSKHFDLDLNSTKERVTLPILSFEEYEREISRYNRRQQRLNLSVKTNHKKMMNFQKILEENSKIISILKKHMENNNELLMTEEEYTIAFQKIKEDITKNKTSVDSPVAIVLGGQPGAGKSNIYQIARKRFSNNLVELDCDAFRVYHPYYQQIKLIFGKEDGAKTNPFIFRAVDQLVDELSDQKYNLIIESSLKRPNTAINNGKILPPKGYEVELHIMATNKEVSWQSTIDRYYEELRRTGKPRAVPRDFHDNVISNICNSLYEVKKSGLMSNILMFDRKQNCLYNMKNDINVEPNVLLDQIINGKNNFLREQNEVSEIGRVF